MSFNIDAILQFIQELRSQLENWGVNSDTLFAVAVVAVILFLFSLREVATWYFRINQVRDEVHALRTQVQTLQIALNDLAAGAAAATPESPSVSLPQKMEVSPMAKEELLKVAEGMREDSKPSRFHFDF